MRVLIIDDDQFFLARLGQKFTREGYEVDLAEDGAVGLEHFWSQRPDLVITDLVMPNREGTETIQALRAIAPDLPIIAMSAGVKGSLECLRVARLLGARAVFPKPFDIAALLEEVQDLLGTTVKRER